jgi:hypothetical protein
LYSGEQYHSPPKTPTISVTRYKSLHVEDQCKRTAKASRISLIQYESLHSGEQYRSPPKMPTISLTRWKSSHSGDQYHNPSKTAEKNMTEEETKIEAQIKEYAANLPSAIDINQLTVEFLRENFYRHPTLALVYYHCCSVDPRA